MRLRLCVPRAHTLACLPLNAQCIHPADKITFLPGIMGFSAAQPPPAGPPYPDHYYVQASAAPVTTGGGEGEAVEVDVLVITNTYPQRRSHMLTFQSSPGEFPQDAMLTPTTAASQHLSPRVCLALFMPMAADISPIASSEQITSCPMMRVNRTAWIFSATFSFCFWVGCYILPHCRIHRRCLMLALGQGSGLLTLPSEFHSFSGCQIWFRV